MRESFFKNKRVLITGHTGFKGSWMTLWLNALGAEVVGFSMTPPSKPYLYQSLKFENNVVNIRGDIRKPSTILKAVRDYEPELVFHLAAMPIVRSGYELPLDTYMTNSIGTLNLLEAVRKFGKTKAVINITTDKVYANGGKKHAYKEYEKLWSNDPYSSSKVCSELITQSYHHSFFSGIGMGTARAGNVIGGGDWGRYRIIPYLLSSQVRNSTLAIRKTDKDAIRQWTYILDVLNGYLSLGEKLYKYPTKYSGAWNFGSTYVRTVMDLIKEFSKHWRIKYKIEGSKIKEEPVLLINSAKSMEKLNWKPLISFRDSVKNTADWYSNFYSTNNRKDITEYSLEQLNDFRRRLHK